MINDDGGPLTSHTTNPVPFIIANGDYKLEKNAAEGALCDVAPTCLDIMVSFTARQLHSETALQRDGVYVGSDGHTDLATFVYYRAYLNRKR